MEVESYTIVRCGLAVGAGSLPSSMPEGSRQDCSATDRDGNGAREARPVVRSRQKLRGSKSGCQEDGGFYMYPNFISSYRLC